MQFFVAASKTFMRNDCEISSLPTFHIYAVVVVVEAYAALTLIDSIVRLSLHGRFLRYLSEKFVILR